MEWNKDTLKEERTKAKMSQAELAKALGVHWRTVQNWEKGTSIPTSVIPAYSIDYAHQLGKPIKIVNYITNEITRL